jgi:hypothetical protein
MNINETFPSKYVKSSDLNGKDVTLTIDRVTVEDLGEGAKKETKPILYFRGTEKGMVCNKTNANTICRLYGPETDNWIGKRILVGTSWVDFAGDQVLALRVRPVVPPPRQGNAKPAASASDANDKSDAAPVQSVQQQGRHYDDQRPVGRGPLPNRNTPPYPAPKPAPAPHANSDGDEYGNSWDGPDQDSEIPF